MNNTVELEEEYDANDENPYGKYSISAPLGLIWLIKRHADCISYVTHEIFFYFSNNTATPIVSLGNIFNSSTANLGLNLTTLVDVNTSTEISDHDITTSVVPTKIGKVQTLRFSWDFNSYRLIWEYHIMYLDISFFKIMDLSLLMSEAVARQFVNAMFWGQRVLLFLERNHLMYWNLY